MDKEDISKLKIKKPALANSPKTNKRMIWLVSGVLAVLLFGSILVKEVFYGSVKVNVISVTKMYPSQSYTLLNASGYVVAQRKASVASKITGRITALFVEEGMYVKKGQVIARLESDDVVALRQQSEANLGVSRYTLEQTRAELNDSLLAYTREKNLLAKEFTTRASYDAAETRYKKASASVSAAEASVKANTAALKNADVAVEYTLIRAPFDAVVLTKNADIGDIVTPLGAAANAKAAVVSIADMDSLQVEADVSESSLQKVKIGQPCEIQLDALPDKHLKGVIHMIVPTADRSKASVMVKVSFLEKDKRILPEMSAKVAFLSKAMTADEETWKIAVNQKAIADRQGNKVLFLVKGNKVFETPVKTGNQYGDMTEILSGAKEGDRVVLNPTDALKNGSKIKKAEE